MKKSLLLSVLVFGVLLILPSCDMDILSDDSSDNGTLAVEMSATTTASKGITLSNGLEAEKITIVVTKVNVVKKGSDDAEKEETTAAKGFKQTETTGTNTSDTKTTEETEKSGTYTVLETNKTIDLLNLQSSVNELLGEVELEPGDYLQLRLIISPDSGIIVFKGDATEYALKVPSGSASGIKLKGTGKNPLFTIADGERAELELNIDVLTSLKVGTTKQGYTIKPVVKKVKFKNKEKEFNAQESN